MDPDLPLNFDSLGGRHLTQETPVMMEKPFTFLPQEEIKPGDTDVDLLVFRDATVKLAKKLRRTAIICLGGMDERWVAEKKEDYDRLVKLMKEIDPLMKEVVPKMSEAVSIAAIMGKRQRKYNEETRPANGAQEDASAQALFEALIRASIVKSKDGGSSKSQETSNDVHCDPCSNLHFG